MSKILTLSKVQKACLKDLTTELHNNKKAFLSWYTGSGKTNIFISYIKERLEYNPELKIGISSYLTAEIKYQIFDRLKEFGLEDKTSLVSFKTGIDVSKNIFVFNPQSAKRIIDSNITFDIFIVDEAHAGTLNKRNLINVLEDKCCNDNSRVLYVTATPWNILAQKENENIKCFHRSLYEGISDDRISDFKIYLEEAQIEFKKKDFTRGGELKNGATSMDVLFSVCAGKMENILNKHKESIGKKVLVICPAGERGLVARGLADRFGGEAFISIDGKYYESRTQLSLENFMNNKDSKFLFVIHKCNIGFDYPEIETIIDLTMSRNITLLAQRLGRVARKFKDLNKKYIYVYDKSLINSVDKLWYLIASFIDGEFQGFNTKTAKYCPVKNYHYVSLRDGVAFSKIIQLLRDSKSIQTAYTFTVSDAAQPKKRTLDDAIIEAKQYESRHDLFKKNPALYKWFRTNGLLDELNKIHSVKKFIGKWDKEKAILFLKKMKTRKELYRKNSYLAQWLKVNDLLYLVDKYLPEPINKQRWSEDEILKLLPLLKQWGHIRYHGGARKWLYVRGLEQKYRKIWESKYKGV